MKILILSNGWTTRFSGGDQHILEASKYWANENDITYIIPHLGFEFCKERLYGKAVCYPDLFRTSSRPSLRTPLLYFFRILVCIFFIPKQNYNFIIASSHYPYDIIPGLIAKLLRPGSKLIVYFHSLDIPHYEVYLFRIISIISNFFSALLIKNFANMVFTVNTFTKEFLFSVGVDDFKLTLTSNGISTSIFGNNWKKTIDGCFIGRHVKHKGIFDLIRIWRFVVKRKPNASLLICGGGEESRKLKNMVKNYDLEQNIVFSGIISEESKFAALSSSRLFIFPSYLEGWGIAIAEAMSLGLPVVAYDLPVYDEVFNNKLIKVKIGNIYGMAQKIIHLLNNPDEAMKIGNLGKNFVQKYSWKRIAENELNSILNSQ